MRMELDHLFIQRNLVSGGIGIRKGRLNRPGAGGDLPDPLFLHMGEAGVEEPMWVYLSFMRRAQREQWFIEHPIGIREITGLTLTTAVPLRSSVSERIVESGVLSTRTGAASLLEIEFDGNRRKQQIDFRPHLPFVFQL